MRCCGIQTESDSLLLASGLCNGMVGVDDVGLTRGPCLLTLKASNALTSCAGAEALLPASGAGGGSPQTANGAGRVLTGLTMAAGRC